MHVPLTALNQLGNEGFDWQVPGFREELVAAMVKTLPKEIRRDLVPAAETTAAAYAVLDPEDGPLTVALARALERVAPVKVPARAFDVSKVPEHLRISFVVDDDAGTEIARGMDVVALRHELSGRVRAAIAAASPVTERKGIVTWDLGDLPSMVEIVMVTL